MARYVKFKQRKRGVLKPDGTSRTCMHCGRKATWTAVKQGGGLVMDVWYCNDHAEYAKSLA